MAAGETRTPTPGAPRVTAPARAEPETTLSSGRALALVGAAVAISTAMALLVTRWGAADPAPAPEGASVAPAPVAVAPASSEPLGDVLPTIVPKSQLPLAPADEVNVSVAPDVPPRADRATPAIVDVTFEIVERVQAIDPARGVQHETWGYRLVDGPDGLVIGTPGPMIRARVGDVLRFTLVNPASNTMPHNVDLHAVTGQGGGAAATTVAPGETRTIEARLLYPGMFMYHCAYGDVPAHISHGMFGGILVDPAEPLPVVEHEWYVVQSEYYLEAEADVAGIRGLDRAALTDELPTHVVFNGAVGALTGDGALQMAVGERARIHFVNAGLNLLSSFHPIGSHWDVVYPEAALLSEPIRGSQTTLVPAGGGTVVELVGQVPSTVLLVDHALTRTFDKGAVGQIVVTGDADPEIFEEVAARGADATGSGDAPVTDEPPPSTGVVHELTIVPGSFEFQEADAPDEFAGDESPADYSTNVLEVAVGDTVRWTNLDPGVLHSVTAADGRFDSGLVGDGGSWSYTFTEPGEFEYVCTPHPWMRAKVVVTG